MGEITKANYPAFKKEYLAALEAGKDVFIFEGQGMLCSYAKYVCEYVEAQL